MWAAGMFLLSAWRTVRDLTPTLIRFHWVSVRVRTSGFRVGVLVACAHTCGRLCRLGLWAFAGGCCLPEDPLVLVCVFFAGHGVHVGCLVDI